MNKDGNLQSRQPEVFVPTYLRSTQKFVRANNQQTDSTADTPPVSVHSRLGCLQGAFFSSLPHLKLLDLVGSQAVPLWVASQHRCTTVIGWHHRL